MGMMTEQKIVNALKKSRKVLVTTHVNPDLDAAGSALALALFLKAEGKDVRVYNETGCPPWLRFIPKASWCRKVTGKEKFAADTVVVLDCGDLDRIGKVKELIPGNARLINIDHHRTNTGFAHLSLVRPGDSSTCEMLYGVLKKAGCVFTPDMAALLYLGILTDTGSFAFDCTSSRTHQVVAELLKFGLPVADLYRQVYEAIPRADMPAFLAALGRFSMECGGRVAALGLSRADMAGFSGGFDVRDSIFSFSRAVKGLDVIVVCTEADNGRVRINFRSRGKFDVARLAGRFGGGGHKNASGCYLDGPLSTARELILTAIQKEFKWKA